MNNKKYHLRNKNEIKNFNYDYNSLNFDLKSDK